MAKGNHIYPMCLETMTKECSRCGIRKDADKFVKHAAFQLGRASFCKECENTRQRAYREKAIKNNPDFKARRELSQRKARAKRYGLTLEELNQLEDNANGCCEICKAKPTKTGMASMSLHVDHCHATGVVRGVLCARCNMFIGGVNYDIDILKEMISYIEKNEAKG